MNNETQTQKMYLELLHTYPSPHNGQPIRMKQLSSDKFELYFQNERGLQATNVSLLFSFVSMGVFVAYAKACGTALGHSVHFSSAFPRQQDLQGNGLTPFGSLTVTWDVNPPDRPIHDAIAFRQTSRKTYSEGIDAVSAGALSKCAGRHGMQLHQLNPAQATEAIWLNQRAVFDDMFDKDVNAELDHWLRYSKKEKLAKKDGLAYDCMEINGRLMKCVVNHPSLLRLPGLRTGIKNYYLRTMKDASDVFYMLAPFSTEAHSFAVGLVVADLWLTLSKSQYYIHPFGTIMSNEAAHRDFIELVGVEQENIERNYLVFIFRAGRSHTPERSLRLPYSKHLLMEHV